MSDRVPNASGASTGCLHEGFFNGDNPSNASAKSGFCRKCGIAMVPRGWMQRPLRFQRQCYSPATAHLVLGSMLSRQHFNKPTTDQFIQPPLRRNTLKCLLELRDRFGISQLTFAKALGIMDKFISENRVEDFDYNIIMVTAHNLASKLNEKREKILTTETIHRNFQDTLSLDEVQNWEIRMLSALDWNVNLVTASDFADFYLSLGVVGEFEEPVALKALQGYDANILLECIDELVDYVLQSTCNEFGFYSFESSQLAGSAIALVRQFVGLEPWSSDLETITKVSFAAIENCFPLLKRFMISSHYVPGVKDILNGYWEQLTTGLATFEADRSQSEQSIYSQLAQVTSNTQSPVATLQPPRNARNTRIAKRTKKTKRCSAGSNRNRLCLKPTRNAVRLTFLRQPAKVQTTRN